jgi:UDP-2,3-diacylglucosamine hydrolase
MSTLFISDLHLQDSRPEIQQWFLDFLNGAARQAEALYILGDLFEYWIGDDALSPLAAELALVTSRLDAGGVASYFIHGNRDFLLGKDYARRAGLRLLPEESVIDLYGRPTLLLHGDTLCTDDIEYQAFRRQARDPAWQAAVLAQSVEERMRMAQAARDASMKHTGSATMEIMDVNEAAVQAAFRRHGVQRMIHGHTHRPAFHRHELADDTVAERIVLADWHGGGSYLEVTAEGARKVELRD